MFIVSLFGGLGSQMDQFSFYLALRKHYPDTIIKLSLCNVAEPHHNGYELNRIFGIDAEEANLSELLRLSDIYPISARYYKLGTWLFNIRRLLVGNKESWITPDDPTAFYKEVFELNPLKSYMFWGNWSNENYRKSVNDEIFEYFKFPEIKDNENLSVMEDILNSNSVSIHVRRGDYEKFGYPMLSVNYYKECVRLLKSKCLNPKFFIFSNDVDFIRKEFDFLDNYRIVDNNVGNESYRDMQLMSLCKHNIIANSSFSYWGARLNRNNSPIVICPKYHVSYCKHTSCLPTWIIVDNHDY